MDRDVYQLALLFAVTTTLIRVKLISSKGMNSCEKTEENSSEKLHYLKMVICCIWTSNSPYIIKK